MSQSLMHQLEGEINAGTPAILINTSDTQYVRKTVRRVAKKYHRRFYLWNGRDNFLVREINLHSKQDMDEIFRFVQEYDKFRKHQDLKDKHIEPDRIKQDDKDNTGDDYSEARLELHDEDDIDDDYSEARLEQHDEDDIGDDYSEARLEQHDEDDIGDDFSEARLEQHDEASVMFWFEKNTRENFILMLEDGCYNQNPCIISHLRYIQEKLQFNKTLIVVNENSSIPDKARQYVSSITVEFPDDEALTEAYREVVDSSISSLQAPDAVIYASRGLTLSSAKRIYKSTLLKFGKVTDEEVPYLLSLKSKQIMSCPSLSLLTPKNTEESIGGFDRLKHWINARVSMLSSDAKSFGIDVPKGVLLVGPPGTGKSLVAKVIANILKRPLFRLDLSRTFSHYMGDSEQNMHQILAIAEAAAPCVLWIDEVEKCMAGLNAGESDGGTASRVFGILINWLGDRKADVFVAATANNLYLLPPEITRSGRFDEVFFLDLPGLEERKEIITIHLRTRGHMNFSDDELNRFAEMTKGFSGAEIEMVIQDALISAFNRDKILTFEDLIKAVQFTTPLSLRRFSDIKHLREVGKSCGLAANSGINDVEQLFQNPEEGSYISKLNDYSYIW